MISNIPSEQPPVDDPDELAEWLTRMVILINGVFDEVNANFMPIAPDELFHLARGREWTPPITLPARIWTIMASEKVVGQNRYLGFGNDYRGGSPKYVFPVGGRIYRASLGRNDSDSVELEIRINDVVIDTIISDQEITIYELDLTINEGEFLSISSADNNRRMDSPVMIMMVEET
jgi:hypothetical protein